MLKKKNKMNAKRNEISVDILRCSLIVYPKFYILFISQYSTYTIVIVYVSKGLFQEPRFSTIAPFRESFSYLTF